LANVEPWAGQIVAELHLNRITQKELAREMGVSHVWVCMLLGGERTAQGAEQRMREALDRIKKRRKEEAHATDQAAD
jgi:transcriptional regulator with XRE-family HTH domain